MLASRNQEAYMSTLVLVEAVTSLGPLRDGVIDIMSTCNLFSENAGAFFFRKH